MRRRNMYYLTGQPGFARLGYSPGWVGRNPSGLGLCAQFILSGLASGGQTPSGSFAGSGFAGWNAADTQSRLDFLKSQAQMLEKNLASIKAQIASLEGNDE